jgi:UDP-N-acetylmuramoyl-tripeptide--D-alanyl-D-alanine ligase
MDEINIKEIVFATKGTLLWGKADINISEVLTNSGKAVAGSLFVPIVGERVDGHEYIQDAFLHGAAACLSHKELPEVEGRACILVEDTLQALQALGTYYREKYPIPVIGITGNGCGCPGGIPKSIKDRRKYEQPGRASLNDA